MPNDNEQAQLAKRIRTIAERISRTYRRAEELERLFDQLMREMRRTQGRRRE